MAALSDVKRYYANFFPHETACKLLGRSWRGEDLLHLREWCVETEELYLRWRSVSSAKELKCLLGSVSALKVHVGAVYDEQPCHKKKLRSISSQLRELVFDVDINDYSNFGIDSDDVEACDAAWPIVGHGLLVVSALLREHFGFRNFMLVYSGRRGAHLSVYDARACALTDEARGAIVSFMQPNGGTKSGRLKFGSMLATSTFQNAYTKYTLPFWTNHCLKPCDEGGMGVLDSPRAKSDFLEMLGSSYASRALSICAMSGQDAWEALCEFASSGGEYAEANQRALCETVLSYVWPRLDANVTKQRSHLSKAWFSLHPKTGYELELRHSKILSDSNNSLCSPALARVLACLVFFCVST